MTRDPVSLSVPLRALVLDEFLKSLGKRRIEFACISVGKVHFHPWPISRQRPAPFVGLAKKESSAYLKLSGHAHPGGLWTEKCECVPIADADHFWTVFGYILNHRRQGSSV